MNAFSSIFGAVLVTLYYQKKIKFESARKQMPMVFKAYWLLATLSTVVSVSLSCVYWPLIYNGRDKGLNDSLTHAGNALVFVIDIFINAHPPRFGHFIYPLGFGVLYAFVFSLPYTLLGGTDRDLQNFIYSVLDWTKKPSAALSFALATIIFLTIMHFVLTFLAVTRIYLHNYISSRSTTNPRVNRSPESGENINQGFERAWFYILLSSQILFEFFVCRRVIINMCGITVHDDEEERIVTNQNKWVSDCSTNLFSVHVLELTRYDF